ncbi:MAG TPA: LamG domain-containing protein [Steroidobacteraceae bacterium]|nr:LamG domain-containing protein [Steroidobacteraceae bacterium]
MNVTRITGLAALAASFALSACGGAGAPTTTNPPPSQTVQADAYTGPPAATADVTAFQVNFWNNVRVQNRCGQCHNATSPAQMPNFARSDDVNLAYAQANTVVNLATPSTSAIVTKVAGGHNCWLADAGACGQILTTWIANWAGASGAASATEVELQAPPDQTVGQSLNFPADYTEYQNTIYTLTKVYCVRCHSNTADPAVAQSPYFADPSLLVAYPAAIPKIDFTGCEGSGGNNGGTCGTNSRFYQRLFIDNHNCWDNCAANAAAMLAQIQAFAASLTPANIDPSLITSKALSLTQGTIASGASRYDADTIAKYEFQSVVNGTTFDTSGIDPSADLTISGSVTLAGGWGINVGAGGKAQATTQASQKIYNFIQATGEFSVEAWVAPALVAADKSYMVSYSGGDTTRNFTLGQTNQNYDFMLRNSNTALTGLPQLATPTAAMALQASLQHVVLTYDSVNGRQIYVNGALVPTTDAQKGGTISNWDSTFALVLGNEVSGNRSWQGLIKFVAIHSRAMSASQVMQNFNAGVGERYYLLFNVSTVTGVSQAYVMFTVSQYDSYGYLFDAPTFVSLDKSVTSFPDIPVQGIRIGINGTVPQVGQAYIPLNTTVTAANYNQGEVLSNIGTVIGLQGGPQTDQFFLTFDRLGSHTNVVVEATPTAPGPAPGPVASDIGVKTFAQINSTLSKLTGVPITNSTVNGTYLAVQQQLPPTPTIEAFSSANQVGVAQLAIQYCNVAVNTPSLQAALFGAPLTASQFTTQPGIDSVTSAIANKVLGTGLHSQPAASAVTTELSTLIHTLCTTNSCTTTQGTNAVAAAACATAFGSAEMMIN